eukprot:CAMPEP_0170492604 /NCGR_PEP_ID=MMETSP0208-20121228/12498_1 /TAXON_ID=197538 /ORGANISM="Strombidium inclinatum, Strain S3" /LENGTH=44 /DNA_ID= /DNA_START= /DNA_END= /DNA_ORIENTATION=
MGYGSGSGQQIVTCQRDEKDLGGLWTVKEADADDDNDIKFCATG